MDESHQIEKTELYEKIKEMSNKKKFRILELTQKQELDITSLAKEIKLAYNKCSNYCASLEKRGLVSKTRNGKETVIRSLIDLNVLSMFFS